MVSTSLRSMQAQGFRKSENAYIHENPVVWAVIILLMLFAIGGGLLTAPEVALKYWYLLAAPVILAAFHFGSLGVIVTSGLNVLIITVIFQSAGKTFSQVQGLLGRFVEASLSPDDAHLLASQMVDLRLADPETDFARALMGLTLVIAGCFLLGSSVDSRERSTRLLNEAFNLLRHYFSPQIIETIISQSERSTPQASSSRKEITILFADLRGFTALSERLEPEETARLLNEFFTAMTEEIFRYDGTLDKYLGDGLMAFFGDPVPHPDHAERAFKAALAMQRRMNELQSLWESQGREAPGMGIGISTGHAIVGNTGSPSRMEYTAIGSTVNIASRLTDLARPGQILTTRKTYWQVQNLLYGIPREAAEVKGFSQPVQIVEVLGTRLVSQQSVATANEPNTQNKKLFQAISRVVDDSSYRAMLLSTPDEASRMYGLSEAEQSLAQQIAVLSGYPIFQGVPSEEIATLVEVSCVEQYSRSTVILHPGAPPEKFYIILQGDVVVTSMDDMQRERHVASLARGDCFGEVALLFDIPRTATVRASSECSLLVLDREVFFTTLHQAPVLLHKIEDLTTRRMVQPAATRLPAFSNEAAPALVS